MEITLKQLKKLGACSGQVDLFKQTFGDSVVLTESIVMAHGGKFDLEWIAKKIFSAPALAEYEKVSAPALAEYKKVSAPALAEYKKVRAPAFAEYEKVRAPAFAEYKKVRDAAWAEYEKVSARAFWLGVQMMD